MVPFLFRMPNPNILTDAENPQQPIVPQPHQIEALEAIREAREMGLPNALIEAATGVGKMVIAGLAAQDQIEQHDVNGRMLFVTHRRLILDHARRTFTRMLPGSVTHGDWYGESEDSGRQMTYASYQKLSRRPPGSQRRRYESLDPRAYKLAMSDESHHAAADTHEPIHDRLKPELFLNFSATPHRHDGRDTLAVTGPVIYRKTLQEALAEGLLTPVRYKLYSDELSTQGVLSHGLETLTMSKLNRAVFIPKRDEEIAGIIKEEAKEIDNPRGLVYCTSIEHAERMAVLLSRYLDVPVRAIHSRLSAENHKEYEEGFRNGSIPIATVIDQFNEGADYPYLNLLVFLRTTASETIFLQQLGRGLRRAPGKDVVTAIDLAGSIQRINMVVNLSENVGSLRRSRPTAPVDKDPPFEFNFSSEVQDVLVVLEKVRHRAHVRERELEPWRQLEVPEPIRILLKSRDGKGERSVELSSFETFCLQRIWESSTGSVDARYLQEAHLHLFKKKVSISKVDELLAELEDGGIISSSQFVLGENKGYNVRLTSRGVDQLAKLPGFEETYKRSVRKLRRVLKDYFTEAKGQGADTSMGLTLRDRKHDRPTFHVDDWMGAYHVREPLNKQDLLKSDITDEELDYFYEQWRELRYSNPRDHFLSVGYLIGKQIVQALYTMGEKMAGAKGVSIYRSLAPGELDALAAKFRDYPLDPRT